MIRAVLFDLDGVLVDAAHWHYLALNRALKTFAYSIPESTHAALYNGLPTSRKLDLLSTLTPFPRGLAPLVETLKQSYTEEILRLHCHPQAGIKAMLEELEAEGYLLGVCSNSRRSTLLAVLNHMEIAECFDVVLSQEDVSHAKPSPAIYQAAMKKLGVRPSETAIVEDSRPGVQAARAACPNVLVATSPAQVSLPWVRGHLTRLGRDRNGSGPSQAPLEILIPMAGLGTRFSAAGYADPKPFIPVQGKPMIEWVIDNLKLAHFDSTFTFLVHSEHLQSYPVEKLLRAKLPTCRIVPVPATTEGAACTLLLAKDVIDQDSPLLIANSDQWVNFPVERFLQAAYDEQRDGMILTFHATETKWSYARTDKAGRVLEVAEKKPISPHATVGIYFFKHAQDFFLGAEKMITKNLRTNGEFYVCPVYNELIGSGKNIGIHEIPADSMHGLGTPEDLSKFLARYATAPETSL